MSIPVSPVSSLQPHHSHYHHHHQPQFWQKALFSGLSGSIATSIIYPLDLIKTRLQNQRNTFLQPQQLHAVQGGASLGQPQAHPLLSLLQKIWRTDGAMGFYRGCVPNILLVMPEKSIKITMNDYWRTTLTKSDNTLKFHHEVAAGGLAGFSQVIATNPMELLKIQGATQSSISYLQLIKKLGISGLYTGAVATLIRDVPFSMVYFSLYAQAKARLMQGAPPREIGWRSFAAGVCAGTIAAALTCPLDVIKTRVHANVQPKHLNFVDFFRREFRSVRVCYNDIVREEGKRALLKGIGPRCLIVSPLFGITMSCYEMFLDALT